MCRLATRVGGLYILLLVRGSFGCKLPVERDDIIAFWGEGSWRLSPLPPF